VAVGRAGYIVTPAGSPVTLVCAFVHAACRQLLGKAEEQEGAELLCGDLVHAIRIHRSGASAAACPPVTTPTRVRLCTALHRCAAVCCCGLAAKQAALSACCA
jgi:hypothetical protein